MALILSIETSTKVCSVALHSEAKLLACAEVLVEKSHSKVITVLCEEMMRNGGYTLNQLNAIAVSEGPGSYTGLRIGVSTAKGLCYSLEKPLIAVNTLLSMAYGVNQYNANDWLLCPMLDARRMEVYMALVDKNLSYVSETSATVLNENSFQDILQEKQICFFGDGAFKMKSIVENNKNAFILDGIYPTARNIGALAFTYFQNGKFEDIAYFEPYYLKDFVSTGK